jgi:LacI family transcriptional regulator
MQTLADLAKVSLMTVSRSLKNHPSISKATRLRIQALAKKVGYRPNPMVSALMAQLRSKHPNQSASTLAYMTAFQTNCDLYRGARQRCDELGYALEQFCFAEPGLTDKRVDRILRARGISGLIFGTLPEPPPAISLKWDTYASVALGYSIKKPVLHRAVNDQFFTMKLAIHKLLQLGYSRIGLALHFQSDDRVDNKWTAAFTSYLFYAQAADRIPLFVTLDWNESQFVKWYCRYKPEVIVSLTPAIADLTKWLAKIGRRIPKDVGLVDLDQSEGPPKIAGINQNSFLVGAAAVDLVVEQINLNVRGLPKTPKVVMIKGEWVPGPSVDSHLAGKKQHSFFSYPVLDAAPGLPSRNRSLK